MLKSILRDVQISWDLAVFDNLSLTLTVFIGML